MKQSPPCPRSGRLVARLRGKSLFLAPDLRREILREASARAEAPDPLPGVPAAGADGRAFLRSLALERLADLYLLLGSSAGACRALRDAALAALDGEEYGYDCKPLPARFLRVRFYCLLDRFVACCAEDTRLRPFAADPRLAAQARRLGGRYL